MTVATDVNPTLSLGALVAERTGRARLFEQPKARLLLWWPPVTGRGVCDARARVCGEIRADLEPHLASEEGELFPAYIAWEQQGTPVDERVIAEHENEHTAVGDALAALRALCHGYDRAAAHCTTHRTLLDALEAFEQDLHRHVHEENNILLLRVRESRVRPEATSGGRPLPCCEGWIAEQTHNQTQP